jgi:hypothetical protein
LERVERCDGRLQDRAFWQVNQSLGLTRAFNDLPLAAGQDFCKRLLELPSRIAGMANSVFKKAYLPRRVASSGMPPSRFL